MSKPVIILIRGGGHCKSAKQGIRISGSLVIGAGRPVLRDTVNVDNAGGILSKKY